VRTIEEATMSDTIRIERPVSRFWSKAGNAVLILGTINSALLAALIVVRFLAEHRLPEWAAPWIREYWSEILLVYLFFEVFQPLVRSVTSIVWVTVDYIASSLVLIAYGAVLLVAFLFGGTTLEFRPMFNLTLVLAIDAILLTALGYLLSRRLIGGAVGMTQY
jgi:hypothetical protein